MPDNIEHASALLRQARSDNDAARLDRMPEATGRYLLQQACEKAIKAFGYAKYSKGKGDDEDDVRRFFFRHDPLKTLDEAEIATLPNGVRKLRREMLAFLARFPERAALEKIDATTPTTSASAVSYRYPFIDSGRWMAPADFVRWADYQGGLDQARTATRKLISLVADELTLMRRR